MESRIKIDLVADTTQINAAIAAVKANVGGIPASVTAATIRAAGVQIATVGKIEAANIAKDAKIVASNIAANAKLSIEADKLAYKVQKDMDKAVNAAKKLPSALSGGAFAIRGIATEMENALRVITMAILGITVGFAALGRQAVNMSAEFEVLRITFENLTGSVTVADQLIRDMKDFAVRTPLQLKDIESAGTMLLALGEDAQNIIPILNTLGQAAVSLNKPLEQFIEVRNLLSGGVILTRSLTPLGIKKEDLTDIAGIGASGAELVAAFDKILAEEYEGLFAKTFETVRGHISNLKDAIDVMFASIGDTMREPIMNFVGNITDMLAQVRTFFEENKEAIAKAFASIASAAESFIAPITNIFSKFFQNLRDHPEDIQKLADSFIRLAKGAAELLIFGNLAVLFLKVLAAVTLLRISLPQLFATLGIGITRVGALITGFTVLNPVALAVTVAVGLITAGLVLYAKSTQAAAERTAKLKTELEEELKSLNALKVGADEINETYNELIISTKTSAEKYQELRGEIQLLINQHPEFLDQLHATTTESGQLKDEQGRVVDTWRELVGLWENADNTNIVNQINGITDALANLNYQQFIAPRTIPEKIEEVAGNIIEWAFNNLDPLRWIGLGGPDLHVDRPLREAREAEWQAYIESRYGTGLPTMYGTEVGSFFEARNRPGGGGVTPDTTGGGDGGGGAIDRLVGVANRIGTILEGIGWKKAYEETLRLAQMESYATLELNKMKDAVDAVTAAEDARAAKLAEVGPSGALDKEALRKLGILDLAKGTPDLNERIKAMGFKSLEEYIASLPDDMNDVFRNFISSLASTLSDAIAQWGWTGQKPNLMGMGQQAISPLTSMWGGDLASMWGLGKAFAGPIGGLISGGIGWLANEIFNQAKPLEIKQPLNVHIDDDQFRLLNFFNFKGMNPYAYTSSFRSAFEMGYNG